MRWTPELNERLRALHSEFHSDREIAEALGSTTYAVARHRVRLNLIGHHNGDARCTNESSETAMVWMIRTGTSMLIERIAEGIDRGTLRTPARMAA